MPDFDDYQTTGDLNDEIYYARLDVDLEQAALEAAGNAYARRIREVEKFLSEDRIEEAVKLCPHGYVGGLTGSCTDGDPRHGEEGYRCFECGGHVSEIHGDVLHVR